MADIESMDSFRAFELGSDPSSDVISLETNRRVSAALHCDDTVRLLLLNGGCEPEHLHVDVVVPAVREPLCFGSHTVEPGKFTVIELARPTRSVRMRVRVIGGPRPIVLDERRRPYESARATVGRLAAAAVLALGFGSLAMVPGAPPRLAARHVAPNPPRIAAKRALPKPRRPARVAKAPVVQTAPVITANLPPARPSIAPPAVAVSTPWQAENGQPVTVSFDSNGQQVHIVAKIGPRTIEDRIIGASRGKLLVKPPRSSKIRVLTINAYAQTDGVTSTRHAIVILLPQIPERPVTNL
jgi:hypothetical protein